MTTKMLVVILLLTFAGIKLDELVEFDISIFTLLGALLGSALAIYLMIRDLLQK
ncbi:MAG: AtpZ/AtpI family protein [Flavobacteriales bacterium]